MQELGKAEVQPSNREVLGKFLEHIKALCENLDNAELEQFFDIFDRLHATINNPTNRNEGAVRKSLVVRRIASEMLEKHDPADCRVEGLTMRHEATGTETHNVLVTFGDPSTGPNTVIMIHHDTITADNTDLSMDGDTLRGRTIQDNTVHLAASLLALKSIQKPERGAITIVYTDYEENGCRGSSAIKEYLARRFDKSSAIALVAAESTGSNLALGHRGKYSTELKGRPKAGMIGAEFLAMYEALAQVQHLLFDLSKSRGILGHSTGTLTTGGIKEGILFAKVDVRTNDEDNPTVVEDRLREALSAKKIGTNEQLIKTAKEGLQKGFWEIVVDGNRIVLHSVDSVSHPSAFNPHDDHTVLPAQYLVTQLLEQKGLLGSVTEVTWGEAAKQNSCPIVGEILLSQNLPISTAELAHELENLAIDSGFVPRSTARVNDAKTIMTDCVVTAESNITASITAGLGQLLGREVENCAMNYMTDIAGLFNLLIPLHPKVLGFVVGVGNPKRLHLVEELGKSDIVDVLAIMKKLPGIIQEQLLKETTT